MTSSRNALRTCVSRCRSSTLLPAFGVSQKWLPRSEYSAEDAFAFDDLAQRGHHRGRRFLLDQLRVVDLAGGVVQDHDQVVPALVLKPLVLAAVDVQQHPRQRPPWPSLAMRAALAPLGDQPRALQRLLDPGVAQMDAVLLASFSWKCRTFKSKYRSR